MEVGGGLGLGGRIRYRQTEIMDAYPSLVTLQISCMLDLTLLFFSSPSFSLERVRGVANVDLLDRDH